MASLSFFLQLQSGRSGNASLLSFVQRNRIQNNTARRKYTTITSSKNKNKSTADYDLYSRQKQNLFPAISSNHNHNIDSLSSLPSFQLRNKSTLASQSSFEEENDHHYDSSVTDRIITSRKKNQLGGGASGVDSPSTITTRTTTTAAATGRSLSKQPKSSSLSSSPAVSISTTADVDDIEEVIDDDIEEDIDNKNDLIEKNFNGLLDRIEKQELNGGKMRTRQLGVLHEDPNVDMRLLMENYTVPALASALRDREDILQQCARYILDDENNPNLTALKKTLKSYHPRYVSERRTKQRILNLSAEDTTKDAFDSSALEIIRKALSRMPRRVTQPHTQRAGVVIPICVSQDTNVPSILLEKRSSKMRNHKNEVCLPGGMVCSINDTTIISTCLREMKEEIIGLNNVKPEVLGILRCNWGDVHHLVGVAVTPVVCYLGKLPKAISEIQTNPDEVDEVFTIPLSVLLDNQLWVHKDGLAPIFIGGPHVIWGLTGYLLHRFVQDILLPYNKN